MSFRGVILGRFRRLIIIIILFLGIIVIYIFHALENTQSASPGQLFDVGQLTSSNQSSLVPVLFARKKLVIWSNEWHCAPVFDLDTFLSPLGVKVIDKNLSPNCNYTGRCSTLKVIRRDNLLNLPDTEFVKFYEAYKDVDEMKSADAFFCGYPPAVCELFESFNKPMIIVIPLRYELGRQNLERWRKLNSNLVRYASDSRNVLAANNLYDVEYFKYFTGYTPRLIRSYGDYYQLRYSATRPGFLVTGRDVVARDRVLKEYKEVCKKFNCNVTLESARSKYGENYKHEILSAHQGIVYVPYQVSVMSFYEQYRMAIPIFAPTLDLLIHWQMTFWQMPERTWTGVFTGLPSGGSTLPPHPSQRHVPDPNNDYNSTAVRYWLKFADYYYFPHVTYYSSVGDLVRRLQAVTQADLDDISRRMRKYNEKEKKVLVGIWSDILKNIAKHSLNHPQ